MTDTHALLETPSGWVLRWLHLIPAGGAVLDVACGAGRHARALAARGHEVHAVDRDAQALARLAGIPRIIPLRADIERGPWPYAGQTFAGIIVTNYLHRPLLPTLIRSLAAPGVLIYETFAVGNERYGRPSNPDFLLRRGELLEHVRGRLTVVGYDDLVVSVPRPAVVQRLCATRDRNQGFPAGDRKPWGDGVKCTPRKRLAGTFFDGKSYRWLHYKAAWSRS
jgi:SAM-dependent methyltransferase